MRLISLRTFRPRLRLETLALIAALYFTLISSRSMWLTLLGESPQTRVAGIAMLLALFVVVTALHFVLLAILMNRWSAKPVLIALLLASALGAHFAHRYGVILSPSMLRNAFETDPREAVELINADLLGELLLTGLLPALVVSRIEIRPALLWRSLAFRLGTITVAVLATVAAIAVNAGEFSSVMREHHTLRYRATPGNLLYGAMRVAVSGTRVAASTRTPIATDIVRLRASATTRTRLLVLVVGETVRAQNWGLNGYLRNTTPALARVPDLINFPEVSSCGTDTASSVPCMFSIQGRRAYDETAIRASESLLHAVSRAGVRVVWRDNQGGCKGVCAGLETQRSADLAASRPKDERGQPLCRDGECLDEALLSGLDALLAQNTQDLLLVLHPLGNHGPAYFRRYPSAFRRFEPSCESANLGACTDQQIRNAYDNAIAYTDYWLAKTIELLKRHQARYDTGLIFVSDHGESLGEKGLYLHGMPRLIAPAEQTRVPMVMWLAPELSQASRIDPQCLRSRAGRAIEHDHLFHTVLGLFDLRTHSYESAWDLAASCRQPMLAGRIMPTN